MSYGEQGEREGEIGLWANKSGQHISIEHTMHLGLGILVWAFHCYIIIARCNYMVAWIPVDWEICWESVEAPGTISFKGCLGNG